MSKYPLDPLKRVRAEKVDQATRAFSKALGEVDKARTVEEERERAKRDHERRLREIRETERAELEKGQLSAGDLARGAAFDIAGEMKHALHARSLEQARADHHRALAEAETKQNGLALAKASADVVEKHRDKWQKARLAESVTREEESAEEAHLGQPKERGRA